MSSACGGTITVVDYNNQTNEGPLFLCFGSGGSVTLLAKISGEGYFPAGSPKWSVALKPTGSNPTLSDTEGTTTTFTPDLPGQYNVHAECWSGGVLVNSDAITVYLVRVDSIAAINNTTTQSGTIGGKNWAAVKGSGDVLLEVTLTPNSDSAAQAITWSGGTAVTGFPRRRKVSKANSAKTNVSASCGSSSKDVDVWILWATVEILTSGAKPAGAQNFQNEDGTQNLGAVSWSNNTWGAGKICAVATLQPTGVGLNAVIGLWDIPRDKMVHGFKDGAQMPANGDYHDDWRLDPSGLKSVDPDSSDKIYDIDAPNIGQIFGATNSAERNDNFRQYVKWNGILCSDYALWYWQARWKIDLSPQVQLKSVGTVNITLPTSAFYSPP